MSSGSRVAGLEMGFARADITPPAGVTLAGYRPRVSTTVAHPLRAEAVACVSGSGSWIVLTGDFLGIQLAETERIRAGVARATGIPADAIAVAGTHTHSGPATVLGADESTPADRRYLKGLSESLIRLGAQAVDHLESATLVAARTTAPELGSNRRIQDTGGVWVNEWRDPDGRHPGYFDPTVQVLAALGADGRRRALLVNYGVHPVVLGPDSTAISADYPGYLKAELERRGVADTVVFHLAAAANINPRVCIETDPLKAHEMGQRLARIVEQGLESGRGIGATPVRAARRCWEIRRTRDAYKGQGGRGTRAGDVVRTELQAFRAGDAILLFVPGELFSEIGEALRKLAPASCVLVVTVANDYVGYLPTDQAQREGAYETLMAPAVGLEGDLVGRVEALFAALREDG